MKKWFISVLCFTLCFLLVVGGVNFLVDPLMQYRPLDARLTFYAYDYDYINPGLAKNADYEAALVTSSLGENTDMDLCEELFGCKMVKFVYPGGTPKNNQTILDVAYRTHDLSRVLWIADDTLFFNKSDELSHELPTYLYDENKFNDLGYLLNISVLYNYTFKDLLNSLTGVQSPPLLRGDVWSASDTFGYDQVIKRNHPKAEPAKAQDYYQDNLTDNLNNILLPLFTAHPETEFDFFFPPKCIAYWYNAQVSGVFDAKFYSMEYLVEALLCQPNVRVFFYVDNMDWTTDISLYKDTIHFKNTINNEMAEKIAMGEGELTAENYKPIIHSLHDTLKNMDYTICMSS